MCFEESVRGGQLAAGAAPPAVDGHPHEGGEKHGSVLLKRERGEQRGG